MKPNEKENIYADEVDYDDASNFSVWGTEDKATTDLLEGTHIVGKWLNLCAGDGRFNNKGSRLARVYVIPYNYAS